MDAPMGKEFVIDDATFARSIEDLAKHLPDMSTEAYYSHVRDDRNDFADWIDDIFDLPLLANDLRTTLNRQEMITKINSFLEGSHHENEALKLAENHELLAGEAHDILNESNDSFGQQDAPLVETNEVTSAEISQEAVEQTIAPQENIVVEDPNNAPVLGLDGEDIKPEVPALSDELTTKVPEEMPAIDMEQGIRRDPEEEKKQQDANLIMQFILMLRYFLAGMAFRKKEEKPEIKA